MPIQVGNYTADGPRNNTDELQSASGVYVILGKPPWGDKLKVVDVGESEDVRNRVKNHERAPCWQGQGHEILAVATIYCGENERMAIERELRQQFDPPCGKV